MSDNKLQSLKDISLITDEPICTLRLDEFIKLPFIDSEPPMVPPKQALLDKYDFSFDGYTALGIPKPESEEDRAKLVQGFLRGLQKLLEPKNNWTFLQVFRLSMDYCIQCQTCSEECHVYLASGRQEIYRPTFRAEIMRRIYKRYFTRSGRILKSLAGADIELNYKTVIRLAEAAYRCSLLSGSSSTGD